MMHSSFVIIAYLIFSVSSIFAQNNEIRVMTYNIRYASENPGEEWSLRKDNVAEMVRFHKPDIFGLQEALKIQVDFFEIEFPSYSWVGVGRDDGKSEGEYSPIFFSTRFSLLDGETFWLSSTPDTPSIGWDAALNRIATTVLLLDNFTNDTIYVYNTHFDHIGRKAREKSAELLINKLNKVDERSAKILIGDFNVTDTSKAYKILNDSTMKDAIELSEFNNYGVSFTFNGFNHNTISGRKIDHIFVNDKVDILRHAIIGEKINNLYPSDHMPVIVDFIIK